MLKKAKPEAELTFLNADTLVKLSKFVGSPSVRQDLLSKTLIYWFKALNTVVYRKRLSNKIDVAMNSQDVDMVSEADLEACLFDNEPPMST